MQGGVSILAHPFTPIGIGRRIKKLKHYTGVEELNGVLFDLPDRYTLSRTKKLDCAKTGGSDSHMPQYAGYAYTLIDTTDLNIDNIINEIEKHNSWGTGKTLPFSYRQERMIRSVKQFFQRGLKRI